jgi:hypothetical protein
MEDFPMKMNAIGTNQKMLVVCVKYSDLTITRLAKASEWITLLNSQVNQFYNQATFNKTNFTFELPTGGPSDGWFNLGYKLGTTDFEKMVQDVIDLVDPYVDFTQYNGILVITNFDKFGGTTPGNSWWKTKEGTEVTFIEKKVAVGRRQMVASVINEWVARSHGRTYDVAAAVAAHEIGHQIGSQTHYSNLGGSPSINRDRSLLGM